MRWGWDWQWDQMQRCDSLLVLLDNYDQLRLWLAALLLPTSISRRKKIWKLLSNCTEPLKKKKWYSALFNQGLPHELSSRIPLAGDCIIPIFDIGNSTSEAAGFWESIIPVIREQVMGQRISTVPFLWFLKQIAELNKCHHVLNPMRPTTYHITTYHKDIIITSEELTVINSTANICRVR